MNKRITYIVAGVMVVVAISVRLVQNKKQLDKAEATVDRTKFPVTVLTASVESMPMSIHRKFPSTIHPFEEVKVYAESSGIIASLDIALGQHVERGQLLGSLDKRILAIQLKKARTDLHSLALHRTKRKNDYLRAKDLYEHKAGLETDMLTALNEYETAENDFLNAEGQVELMQEQLRRADITAPLRGIVSAHFVKKGEFVDDGAAIATITDISKLKATVYVDQESVYTLKVGASANISSEILGDKILSGTIIYISPVADVNHNYQIDLQVKDVAGVSLKGGTDGWVSVDIESKGNTLAIPKTALMTDASKPYVYVVGNGIARVDTIVTGKHFGDKVEVLSGLRADQEIVSSGQINLHDGSKVEVLKALQK